MKNRTWPQRIRDLTVGASVLLIAMYMAITVVAHPGQANAAYGPPPNLGSFVHGSVDCEGEMTSEDTGTVRMDGSFGMRQVAVIELTTDSGWPTLSSNDVSISINGVRQAVPNAALIPAWDGIEGHEPLVSLEVTNLPATQPVYARMRWLSAPPSENPLLFTAWANEPICLITD